MVVVGVSCSRCCGFGSAQLRGAADEKANTSDATNASQANQNVAAPAATPAPAAPAAAADNPAAAPEQQGAGVSVVSERPLALPAGAKAKDEKPDAVKLGNPLADTINKSLAKDGRGEMWTANFVEQDRERLKDINKIKDDELNAKAETIKKNYKDKYGEPLKLDERDFAAAQAVQGQVKDAEQFAQSWPVPLVTVVMAESQTAAAKSGATAAPAEGADSSKQPRPPGREAQVVRRIGVAAQGGPPHRQGPGHREWQGRGDHPPPR